MVAEKLSFAKGLSIYKCPVTPPSAGWS